MARLLSTQEYREAEQRGRREDSTEPRASAAHYDRATGQVVVELKSSGSFCFSSEFAQNLAGAAAKDLARVEISPSGDGLHWPTLDADFILSELMRGAFGTEAWMQRLMRQGKRSVRRRSTF